MSQREPTSQNASFANAFLELSDQISKAKQTGEQELETFLSNVRDFDKQPRSKQFSIGNKLRKLSGRSTKRMLHPVGIKHPCNEEPSNYRPPDIEDLLTDPSEEIRHNFIHETMLKSKDAFATEAGMLLLSAYRAGAIADPARLISILGFEAAQSTTQTKLATLWQHVISYLTAEYPVSFRSSDGDPWSPLNQFATALTLLATLIPTGSPDTLPSDRTSNPEIGPPPLADADRRLELLKNNVVQDQPDTDRPRPDMYLPKSRKDAKWAYNWALMNIMGADTMTILKLHAAIMSHPQGPTNLIPNNAETFARYLRSAGVKRNSSKHGREHTRSVCQVNEI